MALKLAKNAIIRAKLAKKPLKTHTSCKYGPKARKWSRLQERD